MTTAIGSARFAALPGPVRGAIWMILGGLSLVTMAIVIRYLAPRYSVLEMIFLRSVVSLALILPWAIRQERAQLATRRLPLHVLRNVIHYCGNIGWFIGVTLVPLADLSALQFTVPLFTVLMAAIVLREAIGRHRWIATAVGFLGMLVIVRPGFTVINTGTIALLVSALFYATSQTATKMLSRTEPAHRVVFYMALVFVPVSAVPAAFGWVTPGWSDTVPIVLLGITGYTAHLFIVRAFAAADASFVIPFDFLRLPLSALFGFLLYTERPDLWTLIGAAVIFGSTWYNAVSETRRVVKPTA
jgi:drug/metabolite transporter (DMT)-like permease